MVATQANLNHKCLDRATGRCKAAMEHLRLLADIRLPRRVQEDINKDLHRALVGINKGLHRVLVAINKGLHRVRVDISQLVKMATMVPTSPRLQIVPSTAIDFSAAAKRTYSIVCATFGIYISILPH